jgi:hypothetical protein
MTDDRKRQRASDPEEAVEQRASTSMEFPTNVTRSTQDLTIGGSEKDLDSGAESTSSVDESDDASAANERTPAEQAVENQKRGLESGEESSG